MKPIILLVDDSADLLEVLSEALNENYMVLMAMNGHQAINVLKNKDVQLIVSDVMMPIMDGFELCKTIKTNFKYSHIPVILLTAKNTLQAKIEGLDLGADAYIEKPFHANHLQAQIASLLANRRKIKDYFMRSPLTHLSTIASTKSDEIFLEKLYEVIQYNIDDQELDVGKLARLMNIGRTGLFRKIKSTTNLTPNEFVNLTRLKRAAELLANGDHRVSEVSDMVGYSSPSHFGKNFFRQFGMPPKDFQKSKQEGKSSK